jgi:hypothetical protein
VQSERLREVAQRSRACGVRASPQNLLQPRPSSHTLGLADGGLLLRRVLADPVVVCINSIEDEAALALC